jgi:hypothetical protein
VLIAKRIVLHAPSKQFEGFGMECFGSHGWDSNQPRATRSDPPQAMCQAAETFVGGLMPGIIGVFGDGAVPKTTNDVAVAAKHSSDRIGRMPLKQSELQVTAVKHLAFHCSKNLFLMSH